MNVVRSDKKTKSYLHNLSIGDVFLYNDTYYIIVEEDEYEDGYRCFNIGIDYLVSFSSATQVLKVPAKLVIGS